MRNVLAVFVLFMASSSLVDSLASEGELCGGFQQIRCQRGLVCISFDPENVIDRLGICVRMF